MRPEDAIDAVEQFIEEDPSDSPSSGTIRSIPSTLYNILQENLGLQATYKIHLVQKFNDHKALHEISCDCAM